MQSNNPPCRRPGAVLMLLLIAGTLFAQASAPASSSSTTSETAVPLYRLSPGDLVAVRFFFNPELNEDMQIRPDGRVSMQLIGEAVLGGRTIPEVVRELETRYASEIKTPRIEVQVRNYGGQRVFVTGEVVRPGELSLIGGLDVISAIGGAGGPKPTGKAKSVLLIRRGSNGQPVARTLKLEAANEFSERLEPYDVLVVPPRTIVKIDRWVDEYIRQVIPANLNGGFQYLYAQNAGLVSVVPF